MKEEVGKSWGRSKWFFVFGLVRLMPSTHEVPTGRSLDMHVGGNGMAGYVVFHVAVFKELPNCFFLTLDLLTSKLATLLS